MRKVLLEMEKLKDPYSGLGQFCLHLGEQFRQLADKETDLTFYLPQHKKGAFGNNFHYREQSGLHKFFRMNGKEFDVWHCMHQGSHYLPKNRETKLILTVHDLNFLEKYSGAKQQGKLNALQKKVDRAHAITTISEFTKGIVLKHLDTGNKPVHVIHNGNSLKIFSSASKPAFALSEEFIFSIGIISPKKNFESLLALLQYNKTLHLIIAGNNETEEAERIRMSAREKGVYPRLHLPGKINDEEKFWLYKNCLAFVFPSLTEGFGLPVVEAMSLGKPVFLSDRTSLPEVGGTEAYYWLNAGAEHMAHVFEDGMKNFGEDPGKAQRSIEWSQRFSWEKAAQQYLELYRSI